MLVKILKMSTIFSLVVGSVAVFEDMYGSTWKLLEPGR